MAADDLTQLLWNLRNLVKARMWDDQRSRPTYVAPGVRRQFHNGKAFEYQTPRGVL